MSTSAWVVRHLSDLKPNTAIELPYRTVTFHGSTSQVIVIYAPQNGCLRVLDPVYANVQTYNKISPPWRVDSFV